MWRKLTQLVDSSNTAIAQGFSVVVNATSNALLSSLDPMEVTFKQQSITHFHACLRNKHTLLYALARRGISNATGLFQLSDKTKEQIIQELSEPGQWENLIADEPITDSNLFYITHIDRLQQEIDEFGISTDDMQKIHFVRYGTAIFYAIEFSGYLEYCETIQKEEIALVDQSDTPTNNDALINAIEVRTSDKRRRIEMELRDQIKILLPIQIAEDRINTALDAQTVPTHLMNDVREVLFECTAFWGQPSLNNAKTLTTKLTDMQKRIMANTTKSITHVNQTGSLIAAISIAPEAEKQQALHKNEEITRCDEKSPVINSLLLNPNEVTSNIPDNQKIKRSRTKKAHHRGKNKTREISSSNSMPISPIINTVESVDNKVAECRELKCQPSLIEKTTEHSTSHTKSNDQPHLGLIVAALLFGGTVLIAASVALIVISHGSAVSFALAGVPIGAKCITAGAATLGIGGVVGLGASYGVLSYPSFFFPCHHEHGEQSPFVASDPSQRSW